MIGIIVPATVEHARAMAPRMRKEDAAEVWASLHAGPLEALEISLSWSLFAWTWMVGGEPAAMFGIGTADVMGTTGIPWLLSTDAVERFSTTFLRGCKRNLRTLLRTFPHIENYVDARYTRCIRWLEWLGFSIGEPVPFGKEGLPFRHFEMRATHV